MNKFFRTVAITAIIALAGCCGKAHAAQEAKLSVQAVAQAGFDNLSADQQAQVLQSITAAQAKDTTTVDKVDKWVNVGERIGKMMGGAAKEIGVAANDFVKTDVGRWTAILIIWNYMGKDAVGIVAHFGGGLLLLTVGLLWLRAMLDRTRTITITYDETRKTWFGNFAKKQVIKSAADDSFVFGITASSLVLLVISTVIILTV